MARFARSESIWSSSPYTMFREEQNDSEPEERVNEEERVKTDQDYLPPVVFSEPPSGFFAEFEEIETAGDERGKFDEEGSLLTDTMIGQMTQLMKTDPALSIRNKEVKQQSKLGAKFMDSVTKVPLNKLWHRISQFFGIFIFFTNVVVAIYDLAAGPVNLHYKVPSIFFGVVANILLVVWFEWRPNVLKSGTDQSNEPGNDKSKKYQQYAENVLHEALLYPIIVLSVFGFANDKMYNVNTEFFSLLQFILILIDALDVLYTQIMRIVMINKFLNDMGDALGNDVKKIGWRILSRGIFTTISNFVLFVFLILLLGAQVHTDNFVESSFGYRGTVNSTFLLIAVITLPLFNLVVFIAVNYHWVVELLLVLGEKGATEDKKGAKKKKIKNQPGIVDVAKDVVLSNEAIKKKLEGMRKVSKWKKLFSVVTEPVVAVMIVVWEVIIVLAVYYFDGCEHTIGCNNSAVQVIFVLLAIVSNYHAFVVALVFNAGVVVGVLGLLVYPVSVPLFLRGTSS